MIHSVCGSVKAERGSDLVNVTTCARCCTFGEQHQKSLESGRQGKYSSFCCDNPLELVDIWEIVDRLLI